jgi:hypothetical protein
MSRDKKSRLRLADQPADYQKLGTDPVEVARFEGFGQVTLHPLAPFLQYRRLPISRRAYFPVSTC